MASDREIPGETFNTEDFIVEIERWPAIWDLTHDDYSNKNAKRHAWESVIEKFVPSFSDMSTAEKNSIANSYQRKWKSLRDSYTREKSKQRKEIASGSAAKYRKKYIFFEQLRFLDMVTKPTEDNLPVDEEENEEECARMEERNENPNNDGKQRKAKEKRRRYQEYQDEPILETPKAKYCREQTEESKYDDDKLFLLSLHQDLKTLPDHLKLNVKCQIMGIISFAKQTTYGAITPPFQHFPSSPRQHQLRPPGYTQQQPPPKSSHQQPTFNRPPTAQSYQGNEHYQDGPQQHDRPYHPAAHSPAETDSNTSDITTDLFSG